MKHGIVIGKHGKDFTIALYRDGEARALLFLDRIELEDLGEAIDQLLTVPLNKHIIHVK